MKQCAAIFTTILLVIGCSFRDNDSGRTNPFGADSDDSRFNQAPTSISVSSSDFVWKRFDPADSTGDLILHFQAEDPNLPLDTLHYTVHLGMSEDNLDSVYSGRSPECMVANVKTGQQIYFRVIVEDLFDSTLDTTGSIRIRPVLPPDTPRLNVGYSFNHVYLSWKCVGSARGYYLYRADSLAGPYSLIKSDSLQSSCYSFSADRFYRDSVNDYKHYYYYLAAYNAAGQSISLDTLEGRRSYAELDPPQNLSASDGTHAGHISISWTSKSSDIAGFYLYRAEQKSGPFYRIGEIPSDSLSRETYHYNDSVTTPNRYYYKLAAFDSQERASELSGPVYGYLQDLSSPNSLSIDGRSQYIEISWPAVSNAFGYYIYRSISPESVFTRIDFTRNTTYRDSSVAPGIVYYYQVSAFRSATFEGAVTPYRFAELERLTPPRDVHATDTVSEHILIAWENLSGADSYAVYRSEHTDSAYQKIGNAEIQSFRDSSATPENTYHYKVSGIDSHGNEGGLSASTSGSRPLLSVPRNVRAGNGEYPDKIVVTWSPVSNAAGYIVSRSESSLGSSSIIDSVSDTMYADTQPHEGAFAYYTVAAYTEKRTGRTSPRVQGKRMPAPTLSLSGTNTHIQLWDFCVAYADSYYVYRSPHPDSPYVRIASIDTCSYRDSVDFGHYYYKVKARNEHGITDYSTYRSGNRSLHPPTGLRTTPAQNSTVISWNDIPGIDTFVVYKSSSSYSTSYLEIEYVTDTFHVDTIMNTSTYYYRVASAVGNSTSNKSSYVSGKKGSVPANPYNLEVNNRYDHVHLSWPSSRKALGHVIYRGTSNSSFDLLDTTTASYYHDASAIEGVTYYYKVVAYNLVGTSAPTQTVAGKLSAPSAPSGFTLQSGRYGARIPMSWWSVENADAYVVYRGNNSFALSPIDTVTTTMYIDSTLQGANSYYYAVASFDSVRGIGSKSLARPGSVLKPPTTVSATESYRHIQLTWNSERIGKRYRIYRYRVSDSSGTIIDSVSGSGPYFDSVPSAEHYYYRVSSYDRSESALSNPTSAVQLLAPGRPNAVDATDGDYTADTILVSWSSGTGARIYEIYRSSDSLFTSPILVDSTIDTFLVDRVTSDSVYYYRIKGTTYGLESNLSEQDAGFRKQTLSPSAPQGLSVSDTLTREIVIQWEPPASIAPVATGYRVYRSESQTGNFTLVSSTPATHASDPVPASFPTGYWYRVTAFNQAGEGPPTAPVQGFRGKP